MQLPLDEHTVWGGLQSASEKHPLKGTHRPVAASHRSPGAQPVVAQPATHLPPLQTVDGGWHWASEEHSLGVALTTQMPCMHAAPSGQ